MKKYILLPLLICFSVSAFCQEQQVRVFSHRGGRAEFDENTISAFEASYQAGYRGFETDIRLTADGKLVILHDSNLKRTTNMEGAVEKMTAAEIKKAVTKGGHPVMFLDDLMDWIDSKGDIEYVEFEIKSNPELVPEGKYQELCEKVYKRIMKNKKPEAAYIITSSDYRNLRYLQQAHPGVDLLMITSKPCNEETISTCLALGVKRLGAKIGGTSREAVNQAHKKGIIVCLWPGLCPEDAILGAYLGADYLCTDVPVAVKEYLDTKCPWIKADY